jgi:hypothetical protein
MTTRVELINKLWGQENKQVLRAVEELRARGWLTDGSLRGTALCRAQLQNADLMDADLCNTDLHQADLEYADLSNAQLRAAKLTRASLRDANLDRADLTQADLYKANLRGVRNLTDEQLSHARQLWGATMPDGSPYDGRFNLLADLELARWAKVDENDPAAMAEFFGVALESYLRGQELGVTAGLPKAT